MDLRRGCNLDVKAQGKEIWLTVRALRDEKQSTFLRHHPTSTLPVATPRLPTKDDDCLIQRTFAPPCAANSPRCMVPTEEAYLSLCRYSLSSQLPTSTPPSLVVPPASTAWIPRLGFQNQVKSLTWKYFKPFVIKDRQSCLLFTFFFISFFIFLPSLELLALQGLNIYLNTVVSSQSESLPLA
ncbi:hypothetical protein VTN77DRAFT_7980 [Rasamsonia byssochlamydoides]|uniref:uncharacterized protein n=1 Tax=Rasamsonia byssochlamydoides TaxID=89139 RepID=UPI00374316DD